MNETTLWETLMLQARQAREAAYAPYSHFRVGAAVATPSAAVFTGANVENVSYGLCVCAERNAVMQAVLAGHRDIVALAVCSDSAPPAAPCGMCLQVLAEFASDCEIMLYNLQGTRQKTSLSHLLPNRFGGAFQGKEVQRL